MAENAPIIPISAQLKYNIEVISEYVVKKIPIPLRDFTSEPRYSLTFVFDSMSKVYPVIFTCFP